MNFPQSVSFTITNKCNLRCKMCGQWSEEGYMHLRKDSLKQEMKLEDWKRLVNELADHNVKSLLLRGGEPFLYSEIIELLEYICNKGIFIAIDTNGTLLRHYAEEIFRIRNIHLTISVDGPEHIHDQVRGVDGCFNRIKEGVEHLNNLEKESGYRISKLINFTMSKYSIKGLGEMPDVARSLGIKAICVPPYYYIPEYLGRRYEKELKENFDCSAYSWMGFHHESSGIDLDEFEDEYGKYLINLREIYNYPYMNFSEADYKTWFSDPSTPVGPSHCTNIEKLIDIQPNGDADFCVDFPDYTIGNVKRSSIEEIWNSDRAERFRVYRREKPLAVCHKCGAKYISEVM